MSNWYVCIKRRRKLVTMQEKCGLKQVPLLRLLCALSDPWNDVTILQLITPFALSGWSWCCSIFGNKQLKRETRTILDDYKYVCLDISFVNFLAKKFRTFSRIFNFTYWHIKTISTIQFSKIANRFLKHFHT